MDEDYSEANDPHHYPSEYDLGLPIAAEVRRFNLLAVRHREAQSVVGVAIKDFRSLWYVHSTVGNTGPLSDEELRRDWDCTPELDNHHNAKLCPYCTPPAPEPPRIPFCVAAWPECEDGEYNPKCCRFPKSCSCRVWPIQNKGSL